MIDRVQKHITHAALLFTVCALGCATPIGVRPANEQTIYRQMTANALSSERPSANSTQLLARLSKQEQFKKDPKGVLAELNTGLGGPDDHDRLFALAELSYLHARQADDPQYFLSAAVYAYLFLFPADRAQDPLPYDPRLYQAMDLYNRAVTNGLRAPKGDVIDLSPRRLSMPFGQLDLVADPAGFTYGGYELTTFIALEDYEIRGFRNHYRQNGLGAALSAQVKPIAGQAASHWLSPQVKVPVTAFVRFDKPRQALKGGRLEGRIELYDVDVAATVPIDGRHVPLESDPSTAIAYRLHGSPIWDFEIAGFRRSDFTLLGEKTEGALYFLCPYRPGRIPVVFVHGTASSPARWAEMCNELLSDPNIAGRYQFWFFIYNSGNPIALSAMYLRENLQKILNDLDPVGKDPALRNMVVIGHSQGGLLTKLTAVSSGDKFWENVDQASFDKANLSPETRDLLRRTLFVEPLPFVRSLIFISTPHHGSFMAENWIGKIGRRFITLPATISETGMELIKLNPAKAARGAFRIPTAIDNMNYSNPYMRTLSTLPLAPDVKAHSIIAVKGKDTAENSNDGVVRYVSAHIDGVQSELVVRSGHSCQSHPQAIEEVRRILYEHVGIH